MSTLLDLLLDQQPPILEVITHARTAKWNQLGIILELDNVNLAGCHSCTDMYQLWIEEKSEKATRRNLLDALRSIRQNNVANRYEDYVKTLLVIAGNDRTQQTTHEIRQNTYHHISTHVPRHKPLLTVESCYFALSGILIAFVVFLCPRLYGIYPNHLKIVYRSIPNRKWPPVSSEVEYIPLAAVEMKGMSTIDADEFTKFTLYNSPEQILEKKTPILFDDLLKPTLHPDGLKFVLVEGAPGIGKSTLANEICRRWATNPTVQNHLKQFSLVILVQLHDRRAQRATTLFELLPEDFNSDMKKLELQLNRTYGQNILWILDGYDELPYNQRQEDSLYRRLIEGDILKLSTVLVTSRPTASSALVRIVKQTKNRAKQVEILGFNSSRIEQYVSEYFKDNLHLLKSFTNYYNSTPVIRKLMYIPLNTAIVCEVYEENYTKQQFPKTMTELYDAFVKTLISRHLHSKKEIVEDFKMPPRLMCEEDLIHLPETAQKEFWKLTKIAYDGVIIQKYFFENVSNVMDNFGLMNNISSIMLSGTQYTSSFLHTTLQEYFAALYIANKPSVLAKQVFSPILQNHWIDFPNEIAFMVMETMTSISVLRYPTLELVLMFYAGITGKLQVELDKHTFTALSESDFDWKLLARCIFESPKIGTKYHSNQQRSISHLSSQSLDTQPLDYYIVGYLISHFNTSLNIDITSDDSFDFISEAFSSSSNEPQGQLENIHILEVKNVEKLFQLPNTVVKGLKMGPGKSDSSLIINITKSFSNLQLLHYDYTLISCIEVCVHLQTLNHLKELAIQLKGTYEELLAFKSLLIQPGRPIKHLKLSLTYDDCPPLHMLFVNSSLERIELSCHSTIHFVKSDCEKHFQQHLTSQNITLKELMIDNACPIGILSLVSTSQVRSIKVGSTFILSYYTQIANKNKVNIMFPELPVHHPCKKVCVLLNSFKYLKELVIALNGTSGELTSFVQLIQQGRPLRHLRLHLSLEVSQSSNCPPIYLLFYPSSLEKLELFCFTSTLDKTYSNCEATFNKSMLSQNTNLKELELPVNCPYWNIIISSLAIANTSKLRSIMTYHYNNKLLMTIAANSSLHHDLITFQHLEELGITINGTYQDISSFVQLIQVGRPLRHLRLTLMVYNDCPPIHLLFYPSSLETLKLLCYSAMKYSNNHCELDIDKDLISQNTNLKELVISDSCPHIETFSTFLVHTKIVKSIFLG